MLSPTRIKGTVDGKYGEGFEKSGFALHGITIRRNRVELEELLGDRESWKDITSAPMAGWGQGNNYHLIGQLQFITETLINSLNVDL